MKFSQIQLYVPNKGVPVSDKLMNMKLQRSMIFRFWDNKRCTYSEFLFFSQTRIMLHIWHLKEVERTRSTIFLYASSLPKLITFSIITLACWSRIRSGCRHILDEVVEALFKILSYSLSIITIPHLCSKCLSRSIFFVILDDPMRVYIACFAISESYVGDSEKRSVKHQLCFLAPNHLHVADEFSYLHCCILCVPVYSCSIHLWNRWSYRL